MIPEPNPAPPPSPCALRPDPLLGVPQVLPLHQACEGTLTLHPAAAARTLVFTRLPGAGAVCYTKRYRGGTAQGLWRVQLGAEAGPLLLLALALSCSWPWPWPCSWPSLLWPYC